MQRSWKILSESGSPSASSTDANRSSPSSTINSSSDDSNCSNQTLHSMSTTMAGSPPTTPTFSNGDSSPSPPSSMSTTNNTNSTTTMNTANNTNTVNSINSTNTINSINSVNSANTMNTTNSTSTNSTNSTKDTVVINYVTTPQMAESTLQRLRQRLACPTVRNAPNSESAMRSLELLRITVQSAFDKDIDVVIKRFMETYFRPAFSNIKENLGESSVSEEMLQKMSCALLENAKAQYNVFRLRSAQGSYFMPHCSGVPTGEQTSGRISVKRPAAIASTSTNCNNGNNTPPKRAFGAISTRSQAQAAQAAQSAQAAQAAQAAQSAQAPLAQNQNQTPAADGRTGNPATPAAQQAFQAQRATTTSSTTPARRQIFWNTAHISTTTRFVLDVEANQAFGFGTDGRERLASKHPELIRYLPDTEDRDWLMAQNIISQQSRNTRFLFLIYDEICSLQQLHENYRNKSNINLTLMRTFFVPEFMIEKMRHFFVDLNIKSRGLITNSFSLNTGAPVPSNNTNANAGNQSNSSTATNNNNTNSSSSSSQLRTALLHGQATPHQENVTNEDTRMSSGSTSSDFVTTTTLSENSTANGGSGSSTSAFFQPAKTSALSSSHATLTALLNNTSVGPITRMSASLALKAAAKNNEKSSGSSSRK